MELQSNVGGQLSVSRLSGGFDVPESIRVEVEAIVENIIDRALREIDAASANQSSQQQLSRRLGPIVRSFENSGQNLRSRYLSNLVGMASFERAIGLDRRFNQSQSEIYLARALIEFVWNLPTPHRHAFARPTPLAIQPAPPVHVAVQIDPVIQPPPALLPGGGANAVAALPPAGLVSQLKQMLKVMLTSILVFFVSYGFWGPMVTLGPLLHNQPIALGILLAISVILLLPFRSRRPINLEWGVFGFITFTPLFVSALSGPISSPFLTMLAEPYAVMGRQVLGKFLRKGQYIIRPWDSFIKVDNHGDPLPQTLCERITEYAYNWIQTFLAEDFSFIGFIVTYASVRNLLFFYLVEKYHLVAGTAKYIGIDAATQALGGMCGAIILGWLQQFFRSRHRHNRNDELINTWRENNAAQQEFHLSNACAVFPPSQPILTLFGNPQGPGLNPPINTGERADSLLTNLLTGLAGGLCLFLSAELSYLGIPSALGQKAHQTDSALDIFYATVTGPAALIVPLIVFRRLLGALANVLARQGIRGGGAIVEVVRQQYRNFQQMTPQPPLLPLMAGAQPVQGANFQGDDFQFMPVSGRWF